MNKIKYLYLLTTTLQKLQIINKTIFFVIFCVIITTFNIIKFT